MCTFELAVPIQLLVTSYHILPSPYQNHSSLHGLFLNPEDGGSRLLWLVSTYRHMWWYMQEDSDFQFTQSIVSLILMLVSFYWMLKWNGLYSCFMFGRSWIESQRPVIFIEILLHFSHSWQMLVYSLKSVRHHILPHSFRFILTNHTDM